MVQAATPPAARLCEGRAASPSRPRHDHRCGRQQVLAINCYLQRSHLSTAQPNPKSARSLTTTSRRLPTVTVTAARAAPPRLHRRHAEEEDKTPVFTCWQTPPTQPIKIQEQEDTLATTHRPAGDPVTTTPPQKTQAHRRVRRVRPAPAATASPHVGVPLGIPSKQAMTRAAAAAAPNCTRTDRSERKKKKRSQRHRPAATTCSPPLAFTQASCPS